MKRYEHALEMLKLSKNDKVLEIGCGVGYQIPEIAKRCKDYTGIDFSKKSIMLCKTAKNIRLLVADAHRLPFKKSCFDAVLLIDVLENLRNPEKTLEEVKRVLKDNGKIVVSVPNWRSIYGLVRFVLEKIGKWRYDLVPPIDDWFTNRRITSMLKRHGFEIEDVRGSFFLPPFFTGKHYLVPTSSFIPKAYDVFENLLNGYLKWFGYHILILSTKPSATDLKKVSVILPTYNERENIREMLTDILRHVPGSEIIVVDDNSPDNLENCPGNEQKEQKNQVVQKV
jgi:ubiquinone/menaquinone biosynthesis C-methylase UbiE